ncbi:pyridoxal-5'-phosphate-dependent protein [Roseibium algicola]|uniref:Pyridoxal-5'-phosphate-dependent protein n=1 Tax=Roseibium algicola TaxID=2857014 RepID=A0ABM6I4R1_9HYPH|nr:threonine/serine dehydratase [Roseibium aggregatum]AQQ05350.1 pyridoxal-5'-phosphate-dependent protein [Roseibium aggregatum]
MNLNLCQRKPTFTDVTSAAQRIAGRAVRTPLLESDFVNKRVGGRLLVKAEPLQVTGSFKFRGAFNRIAQLNEEERKQGILAYSGGNHAQGVAAAAHMLGVHAIVLMPSDAPEVKIRGTQFYGAEVVLHDRWKDDRDEIARRLIGDSGRVFVPPFDDADIIAGQATVGLEISQQAAELDANPDAALICCSGGGLTAGAALALKHLHPQIEVFCVEPDDFDDTRRSLISGIRENNPVGAASICDALLARLGELTFSMNQQLLSGGLTVNDDEVLEAMFIAFTHLRLVVEPGGAVALAAALSGKLDLRNRTTAVVVSGGNVDPDMFRRALSLTQNRRDQMNG